MRAGRDAIGVEDEPQPTRAAGTNERSSAEHRVADGAVVVDEAQRRNTIVPTPENMVARQEPEAGTIAAPRSGSKQALLVDLLRRNDGVEIAELMGATGWLSHTVRAALTGLRKRGHVIVRTSSDDRVTRYQIVTGAGGAQSAASASGSLAEAA